MPLFVHQNEYTLELIKAIDIISQNDPLLQIEVGVDENGVRGNGRVSFFGNTPADINPFTQTLMNLSVGPVWIGIRGESYDFQFDSRAGYRLSNVGGAVFPDSFASPTTIDILYSANGCGPGSDFWVTGESNSKISIPIPIMVFHELAHAEDIVLGNSSPSQEYAIDRENELRTILGEPIRTEHTGGCTPPSTNGGNGGCFVATAAHNHSILAPDVKTLRDIRDRIIRHTTWGKTDFEYFYEYYKELSPFLISAMDSDERLRSLIRNGLISPIVFLSRIMRDFPNSDIRDVPEPWNGFLKEMQSSLGELTSFIPLPETFTTNNVWDTADELIITLRYLLRSQQTRHDYLNRLIKTGQLPLVFNNSAQRHGILYALQLNMISPDMIPMILGEL